MLTHLYISNYALIEELDIDFHNGFSVITGETGAGKSIILGALGLLLGKRADAQAIKNGEKKCSIEASFDIRALNLKSFFADNDIDNDDTECILRREVINTGKSRAFINDTPVSLTQLKELGTYLIDIHSQHQNLLMNQEDFLLDIVDTIAGNQSLRETYLHTFEAWKRAQTLLLELQARAEKDQANQDYLKFQIQQFQEANLSEGEQEELEQEASTLNHAEDIKQALFAACAPLVSEELRLLEELKNGVQKLESISAVYPQAQEMAERLNSAYIELEDLSSELEKVQMEIEFDPIRQNFVEERLNTIYSLEQKHKVSTIAELLQIYDDLQKRLNEIENIDETLKEKEKEVEQQLGALAKSAKALTKSRETAAKTIAKSLIEQLQTLGMPHVKLEFSLTPKSSFDRNGSDTISLLFSANKNRPLQDVAAIASGGEIARLMLSLKALIAKSKALPTIIFDEIDTGVSGTMAEKMALTMQQIADNCQVLCITHLPQIAALGAHHYRVYKVEGDDKTTSHISLLSQEERIKEIANMLTGSEMTEAAINNAKSLLRINWTMKYLLRLILLLTLLPGTISAGTPATWLFKVFTYDAQGQLKGEGNGFFLDEKGTGIAPYHLFKGASKAVVVDDSGKKYNIQRIEGANSTYDVIRFSTNAAKKKPLSGITTTGAQAGSEIQFFVYSTQKNAKPIQAKVEKVNPFNTYNYYDITAANKAENFGCPLYSSAGELIGIIQRNVQTQAAQACALDARFINELQPKALNFINGDLLAIKLPIALPNDEQEAMNALYLINFSDTLVSANAFSDFTKTYPQNAEGWALQGKFQTFTNALADADRSFQKALSLPTKNADAIHYIYSTTLFNFAIINSLGNDGLLKAMAEAQKAYTIKPKPLYLYQEAQCLFAMERYKEAYDKYLASAKNIAQADGQESTFKSPEAFYGAAISLEKAGGDNLQVLALLDSVIANIQTPLNATSVQYYWLRAQQRVKVGKFREAIIDLNEYERNVGPSNLTDKFYVFREQAEMQARMFQQALDDIRTAQTKADAATLPLYQEEEPAILLRVGDYKGVIQYVEPLLKARPEEAGLHLIIGVAYGELKQKAAALRHLERSQALGNEDAPTIIKKYK